MGKNIFVLSLESAIYFSVSAFIAIFISSSLNNKLQGTTGELDINMYVIITLCIIFILFLLAISNIIYSNQDQKTTSIWKKLSAIAIFILVSGIILTFLSWITWVPLI